MLMMFEQFLLGVVVVVYDFLLCFYYSQHYLLLKLTAMLKRINELSFVIGLFFTLVAIILLAGYFVSEQLSAPINLYTGIVFLVFGLAMIVIRSKEK